MTGQYLHVRGPVYLAPTTEDALPLPPSPGGDLHRDMRVAHDLALTMTYEPTSITLDWVSVRGRRAMRLLWGGLLPGEVRAMHADYDRRRRARRRRNRR